MKPDASARMLPTFVRHMINRDFTAMRELGKEIDINSPVEPSNRTTALHRLAKASMISEPSELAQIMIEELGAKPNLPDADGNTPMHYAAQNTQDHSLATYLSTVSDINARNKLGRSPIMEAAYSGSMQNVIALARLDADLGIKDTLGLTIASILKSTLGDEGTSAFEQVIMERQLEKSQKETVVIEDESGNRSVEVNGVKVDIDITLAQQSMKPRRRL